VLFEKQSNISHRQEKDMKVRSLLLTLGLCFAGTALGFAQNAQMGTWKLNETKSKIPAGLTKNTTVIYAADGDKVKVTTDGTDGHGAPIHTEWTGKFDDKDYPLTGDSASDSRCYKKIDDRTVEVSNKKGGKVTMSGRVVVSPDGKTRTVHLTATDSAGKKTSETAVYDKE
jgi:hypothetical protein